MEVVAGLRGEDGSVREGEGHGWLGRANEVGKRGEDRLANKEDMRSTGIGKYGRRSNRT